MWKFMKKLRWLASETQGQNEADLQVYVPIIGERNTPRRNTWMLQTMGFSNAQRLRVIEVAWLSLRCDSPGKKYYILDSNFSYSSSLSLFMMKYLDQLKLHTSLHSIII